MRRFLCKRASEDGSYLVYLVIYGAGSEKNELYVQNVKENGLAILHVRSEGALVRDTAEQSDLLELLSERGYDASAVTARYVPSVGSKNSTLAVTCPADPPLTWHLTEVEKICIRQNWTDIESTLATKVKEFLHSPVSSPDFTKPPSIRREHVKEGLYLHEVLR